MSLREGLVVDRYVVEHPIGKGGTAEVWSVRHRTLGTRRALKVLSLQRVDLHARLIEEGRAQARLSSEHIVPVLDVLDIEGAPALVMPLIEGPTLAQLLAVHRPSEAEVAAIMMALLDGVRTAHAAGFVHRDLKPANVLLDLTSGGVQPRIADFGIARTATSDVTQAGAVLGTPAYAAPEQLRDTASVDARADFWSLGVILYQLLSGTLPFRGDDLLALVHAMEAEQFAVPSTDPRWTALVRDLLRARRDSRLCDFDEIRDRIGSISPPTDRSPLGAGTPFATVAWRIRAVTPAAATAAVAGATTSPSVVTRADNLPRDRDAFVGRDAEASTLRAHLARSRLVTVTGPGGVGKTRLTLHVARSVVDEFSSVAFCELTEARSLDGILYAVARGLDVALGADPIAQLGHAIAGRGRFLLVLDNFEQVVEHAAATVGPWIDRAPNAVLLVTSREPLRLRGEAVFPLDVLSLPLEHSRGAIDGSEAVNLFVTRAQQADPSFRLTEDNAATVAELVRRLDGLPLAIELAAARVRSSTPARLLERLSKRFDVLATASRDVADRQRSLRATLDWSWEQLGPTLRQALAQLSVFEGGWTLEAAESVVRLDDEAAAVEDVLAELVDRSLVRTDGSAATGGPRLGMLVSVHEYATEKLRRLEDHHAAEARHGTWFARFGTPEAIDSLSVHGGVTRRLALGRELDNLIAACGRAVTRADGAAAAALLEAAWPVLFVRGPLATAVACAQSVLGLPSLSTRERASTLTVLGAALARVGRVDEGRAHLGAAREAAREVGDHRQELVVLWRLGRLLLEQGRMGEARSLAVAALDLARGTGDRRREGIALLDIGTLDHEENRGDQARAHLEAALAVVREVGDRRTEGATRNVLGILHGEHGRPDEARHHYDAALAVARETADLGAEWAALGNLAYLLVQQGQLDAARALREAALAGARAVGDRHYEGILLGQVGAMAYEQGRVDEARRQLNAALEVHRGVGNRRAEGIVLANLGEICSEQGQTDEARIRYDAALVAAREVGSRRLEGQVLGQLGDLLRVVGEERGTATQHLEEALRIHREIGYTYAQPRWLDALALIEAEAGRRDVALALSLEAVAVAGPYPDLQVTSLETLARVHLVREDLTEAREAIARARAMAPQRVAPLAAVDALVSVAEGDRAAAEIALEEATADPAQCPPGSEVAQLVAQARTALQSLSSGAAT